MLLKLERDRLVAKNEALQKSLQNVINYENLNKINRLRKSLVKILRIAGQSDKMIYPN